MGRHDHHDPTMISNSSIALLQERFRQLEKVKERREGKELLKLFSSDTQTTFSSSSSAMHFQTSEYSSSLQLQPPRLEVPHNHKSSTIHAPLSLGLSVTNKQGHHKTPSPSNSWSQGASASNFEHSDVDTSLHL